MELHRLLVPVVDNPESERAMDVACRLADDRGSSVAVLHVVEVPAVLPLGAHMDAEEQTAHRLLERAASVADAYGVGVAPRTLVDRDAGEAIVGFAARHETQLIVIGAPRKRGKPFGSTVEHVLRRAACRVLVIGEAAEGEQVTAAA